jgi:MerR family copper efflux transcriptional regulator
VVTTTTAAITPAITADTELSAGRPSDLVPIDQVARRLGLRASAIRYYEERGLVTPASRHAGRRWYSPADIRRLAIIRFWQQSALMSLEEIGEILEGTATTRNWSQIVQGRIAELGTQIERMETARAFLEHEASKHDTSPDGCPHFEAHIWDQVDTLTDTTPTVT